MKRKETVKELYEKYREIIIYVIVGVVVSIANWGVYFLFTHYVGLGINSSNIIAWIVAVLVAFVLNKEFVFARTDWQINVVAKEFFAFVLARIFSGIIDVGSVPLLMKVGMTQKLWVFEGGWAKFTGSIVSSTLNFVLSKWIIFTSNR